MKIYFELSMAEVVGLDPMLAVADYLLKLLCFFVVVVV
jgi:hypothetical protein